MSLCFVMFDCYYYCVEAHHIVLVSSKHSRARAFLKPSDRLSER